MTSISHGLISSKQQGFTLLEIMLVLMLIGLAVSIVVPRVSLKSSTRDISNLAQSFAAMARSANQFSLVTGRTLGVYVNPELTFKTLTGSGWTDTKVFNTHPVPLPEDVSITVEGGASFWQKALDHSSENNLLPNNKQPPPLIFWSSGEISPVTVSVCLERDQNHCVDIVIEESGSVSISVGEPSHG